MHSSRHHRPTPNSKQNNVAALPHFDVGRWLFSVGCSYLFLCLYCSAPLSKGATAQPGTAPSSQPTAPDLQATEWAVFVIDGATGQLNPEGIVTATLPAFVADHRYGSAGAPPDQPRLQSAGASSSTAEVPFQHLQQPPPIAASPPPWA